MRFVERAPLRVRVLFIVLAGAVVLGSVLMLLGFSPAVGVIAALGTATLFFGQRFGWATSVAAAVLMLLFGNTVLLRLVPLTGIDLGLANGLGLLLASLALLAWLLRQGAGIRLPNRGALTIAGAAVVVPAITGIVALVTLGVGERMRVGWMMGTGTDTVWNTVASRYILNDNGIAPWLNPNPSPLVNGLMATWYAPGRGAAEELLRHDVTRQSELLVLLFLLCSVLAGIVVARVVPARRPVLRWVAGIFGSLLPLTWYMAGFVIRFGFFNVAVAVAVLLCVWLIWSDLPRHSAASIGYLLIATTVLLAAWAPLAALPLALAGVAALMNWRTLLGLKPVIEERAPASVSKSSLPLIEERAPASVSKSSLPLIEERAPASVSKSTLRGWPAALFVASAAQLVLYVLLATLPDLTRDGGALSANGGVPEITPLDVVLVGVLIFAFGAVASVGLSQRHELLGIVVVLLAASVGVAYLALQRRGMDTLWGYYPAKLGWLVSVLLIVLLAASLMRWLGHGGARGVNTLAVLLAAAAVVGLVMAKVPPIQRDLAGIVPLIGIGLTPETAAETAREDALFAATAADDGEKVIFAAYSAAPEDDAFINYWSLQLPATTSDDPIRMFASTLDSTHPADVCA